MTVRLYYGSPDLTAFTARVVERLQWHGRPAVALDRTAFYATGGGQPHDTGTLNGVPVVDVVERDADGAVIHVLEEELPGGEGEVQGQIDWNRRFDLMQQHTGQHLLSAALVEALGANTVSFHLSADYATIDLDRAPLSAGELDQVEILTNQIVFENRPVVARFVSDEDLPALRLRKPLVHEGPVRIVEIPDFDCSACGGTHVQATGEVGLVKIIRTERRGTETRVEFLCGGRALADYRAKNRLLMDLAREYTVGHGEVVDLVHRLDADLKEARHELRAARNALLDTEAAVLRGRVVLLDEVQVIRAHLPNHGPEDLKHLAQRLVIEPGTAVLLGEGERDRNGSFVFACSGDVEVHMGDLVRRACAEIGGRGGGRPQFAQGGGPRGEGVGRALEVAFDLLARALQSKKDPHHEPAAPRPETEDRRGQRFPQ